ncbi:CAP domain-containing protein [Halomicronema sp. CCY15110]|uniref:CAP domain-containing protein n=1 Tax=Halomicronema sp. CCY15110 TaxID=2767773 RepID=UPI00194F6510|nr:CAP domain-containing protein [Halomicronema sp. CCY15110]
MENNSFVLEVINLTNQHRTQMGLSALSVDIDLKEAAQYHSGNMAVLDFFDHQDLDGKRPADRAEDFGYETRYVGENIALGQTTPQAVFTAWLNSSGHRANIENANYNEIGVGYYFMANDPGTYTFRHYWTQKFGRGDIENPGGGGTPANGGGTPVNGGGSTPKSPSNGALPLDFDPLIYGASHHDLMAAFGTNAAALQAHYLAYGQAEGRSYDRFDAGQYLAAYDDLLSVFGNDLQAATLHYMQFGRQEGRSMQGGIFDPAQYLASYQDLINAFGYNLDAATAHYQQMGQFENRNHDRFNESRYLASNPDLIQAFGYDLVAATAHYISFGSHEGRGHGSFDAATYLQNYGDLQAAFGSDLNAATQHYIQSGFAEGRSPV